MSAEPDLVRQAKSIVGQDVTVLFRERHDVKPGDQIECFERIEVQRTL